MKFLKKILIIILIILLTNIFPIATKWVNVVAASEVSLSLVPQPYIDVVLAKSQTTTDLTNFRADVLNALKAQGVDISKVNVSSIETVRNEVSSQDVNVDKIINSWETIGSPTWSALDGKIYSNSPGGNNGWGDNPNEKWNSSKKRSWWGTGLLDPEGYESKAITMDFTMVTGGSLNEGVCFNVTKNSDGSLNGYFVTICNHANMECRLWKFNHYTLDLSFSSGINGRMWCCPRNNIWNVGQTTTYGDDSFTALQAWSTSNSNVTYHIEYEKGRILIKADGNVVADVRDNTYTERNLWFLGK